MKWCIKDESKVPGKPCTNCGECKKGVYSTEAGYWLGPYSAESGTCTNLRGDIKDYKDKLNYVPLQWEAIEAVAKVFKYAEKKYGNVDSWRQIDSTSKDKYLNALMRHLVEIFKGNEIDPESELPHIYAVCWNALTSCYIKLREE